MDVLAEAIESVYSLLGEDHVEDEQHLLTLQQSVKTLISSLDSINDPSVKDDHHAAEVITQGIRVLAMLLFVGRDENSNLQEICTLIWKSYGKIIKKFNCFIDIDSAKQFLDTVSSHTKDGILHISAVCTDTSENIDAYHKVLMFFGQRLALSLICLPPTGIEEEMKKAFHILIALYGLNSLLIRAGRSEISIMQQSIMKHIQKLTRIEEWFASSHTPRKEDQYSQHSHLFWMYHAYSLEILNETSELFVEVHCGYLMIFSLIMETENLNYATESASMILSIISRWLLHNVILITNCSNGETNLLTLPIGSQFMAKFLRHNASEGHLLMDWLICLSFGGKVTDIKMYDSLGDSVRINDDVALVAFISRHLLVFVLQQLSIQSPEHYSNAVWTKWQSNWTHRMLDMIIAQCEHLMALGDDTDVYGSLETLADIVIHFLSSNVESCSEVIMRRIAENFLLNASPISVTADVRKRAMNYRLIPLPLLESIFARWPVRSLLFPTSNSQSSTKIQQSIAATVKSLVQKAVSLLQVSVAQLASSLTVQDKSNNISYNETADAIESALPPSTPALCISILSSVVYENVSHSADLNVNMLEQFKQSLFPDEVSLRNLSTRMLQITRTLTAQMQLYTQNTRQLPVVAYKIRDWMRHISLLLAMFRFHSQTIGQNQSFRLPNGVQRLIAECLSRIVLCWKAIILREQECPSSFSVMKLQPLLRETIRSVTSMLSLLVTQPVEAMKTELQQEITFALEEFAKAMQASDASCLPVYCEFGSELLALIESTHAQERRRQQQQHQSSPCWLETYLDSAAGTVWRNLLQLSVQRSRQISHRQDAIIFLQNLNNHFNQPKEKDSFSWPSLLDHSRSIDIEAISLFSQSFLSNETNFTTSKYQFSPPWPQYVQAVAKRINSLHCTSIMDTVTNTITTSTSTSSMQSSTINTSDAKANTSQPETTNFIGQKRILETRDDVNSTNASVTDGVVPLVTKKLRFAMDQDIAIAVNHEHVSSDGSHNDHTMTNVEGNGFSSDSPMDEEYSERGTHLPETLKQECEVSIQRNEDVDASPAMDVDTFYNLPARNDVDDESDDAIKETHTISCSPNSAEDIQSEASRTTQSQPDSVTEQLQPSQTAEVACFGWGDDDVEKS